MAQPTHQPVLLKQTIELLAPQAGESYLDLTAGGGGHAQAISKMVGRQQLLTLVDRDSHAVETLKKRFPAARIINSDFASAATDLAEEGYRADMCLLDLGLSLDQLRDPNRGFSFRLRGPLDMRMDQTQDITAADILNHMNQRDLADLIYRYGGEHRSRQIAQAIVRSRPIADTIKLAETVAKAVGGRRGRIHPATKTFQAIRIAVNQELVQLEKTLPYLAKLLKGGGRLVIISFHSLEDRLVKNFLKDSQSLEVLIKKPVQGRTHDASNPRARSAKLRAAIKNKNARKPRTEQGGKTK